MKSLELKNKNGFTMIELVVVMGIIGFLATMAVPSIAKMSRPPYLQVRNYGYAVPFASYNFLTVFNPSVVPVKVDIEFVATNLRLGIADTWEYGLCLYDPGPARCDWASPLSDGLECSSPSKCTNRNSHKELKPGESMTFGFGTKHDPRYHYYGYAPEAVTEKNSRIGLGLRIRVTDEKGGGNISATYASYDDVGNSTFTIALGSAQKL